MSKDRLVPENDNEILEAFIELLTGIVPDDPVEISNLLKVVGLDPLEVKKEAADLISNLRSQTPLDWRNNISEVDEAQSKHTLVGKDLPTDRQNLITLFEQLLSVPAVKKIHSHYRNIKTAELSDDEIRTYIQDLSFIIDEQRKKADKEIDS